MKKFHAVLLVDCFADYFGTMTEFYNDIKSCLKQYEFDNLIFSNQSKDTNTIDENLKQDILNAHGSQPQVFEVSGMYDLFRLPLWEDSRGYDILYGGRAWGACLHFGSVSIGKFHSEPIGLYIDPQLITNEAFTFNKDDDLFLRDPMYEFEKLDNNLYKYNNTKRMSDPDMFIKRRIYENTDC